MIKYHIMSVKQSATSWSWSPCAAQKHAETFLLTLSKYKFGLSVSHFLIFRK